MPVLRSGVRRVAIRHQLSYLLESEMLVEGHGSLIQRLHEEHRPVQVALLPKVLESMTHQIAAETPPLQAGTTPMM